MNKAKKNESANALKEIELNVVHNFWNSESCGESMQ